METSVPRFQTFVVAEIVRKKRSVKRGGGAQLLKKEDILKNGVKRGDMTSFSTKKNIAEENLFKHDIVGSARFGLFFQYFFLHKHTPKLHMLEDNGRILITKRYLNF